MFMSSIERETRMLHFAVVQWQQRNVQKCVMQVQSFCFANLDLAVARSYGRPGFRI